MSNTMTISSRRSGTKVRLFTGDVVTIICTPNCMKDTIDLRVSNPNLDRSTDETISIRNCIEGWRWLKANNGDRGIVVLNEWNDVPDDGYYHPDNIKVEPFEHSIPYLFRFNRAGLPAEYRR